MNFLNYERNYLMIFTIHLFWKQNDKNNTQGIMGGRGLATSEGPWAWPEGDGASVGSGPKRVALRHERSAGRASGRATEGMAEATEATASPSVAVKGTRRRSEGDGEEGVGAWREMGC